MSGHRALTDNYLADTTVEDPGDAGTITIDRNPAVVELVTTESGGETRTLADPTQSGIFLVLTMKTDGGACVVTGTAVNETGNTTMSFDDPGETLLLVSVPDPASSTDYVWRAFKAVTGSTGDGPVLAS